MKNLNNKKSQGFTLIEVVLVLAIAGLIFLIVFLALPALQRSQRDTARKNDVSRFASQVTNYQSNNQGAIPANQAAWDTFKTSYMTVGGQKFEDPQAAVYTLIAKADASTALTTEIGSLNIYPNAKCDGTSATKVTATGANARDIAVVLPLEQGGYYCQGN